MVKPVRVCECVVASLVVCHVLSSIVVLIVRDILTSSVPSLTFWLKVFLRVNKDFHSFIVETSRFNKVKEVKFDPHASSSVLHLEVKPLSVPFRVYIILEDQVIFEISHLVSHLQITWFEATFKHQSVIIHHLRWVVGSCRRGNLQVTLDWVDSHFLLTSVLTYRDRSMLTDHRELCVHISRESSKQLFEVTCSNQLGESWWAKFLFWIVKLLPKSAENNGILFTKGL